MTTSWILALALYVPNACFAQNSNPPLETSAPQTTQPANPSMPRPSGAAQPQPQQLSSSGDSTPPPAQSDIDSKLQMFVYPAKGQSPAQQSQDEQQCFGWAQSSAANQAPANTENNSAQQKSGAPVAGGTAKGAAAGAAIGAIAGDAGEGAAIGATGGVMAGAHNRRKAKQQAQQQQQAQQTAQQQQATDVLRRAYSACLEPKGYSVK